MKAKDLRELMAEGETLAKYTVVGVYVARDCIVPDSYEGGDDISACLEDTLHRMIDAGWTDDEIYRSTGMYKEKEEDEENTIYIDLGYVLPLLLSFEKQQRESVAL